MKYQTATLLLAGLANAAPITKAQSTPPSKDAARAGGILSGVATGIQGASFPGAESVASILNGIGGGLSKPTTRGIDVDVNSLVQTIQKRQTQPAHAPPTTADMQRASGIVSGIANGFKGTSIPGADSISSILSGVGSGLDKGAKTAPTKRQSHPAHPAHPPATAADMERASSILKGVSDGINKSFPGSSSISSILTGVSGGLKEGAKNPPSASHPQAAAPKAAGAPVADPAATKEKRQGTALPPPGTPEARKSAAGILQGIAGGFQGTHVPGSGGIAGILNAVGGGLDAASTLPPSPHAANGRPNHG